MAKTKISGKAKIKSNGKQSSSSNGNGKVATSKRLSVLKTYKLYIGGKFPRTESGRFIKLMDKQGNQIANICRGSRKDFRNAVVAARKASSGWAERSAYNRGQILYRIAEILEGRRAQFIEELTSMGSSKSAAEKEVNASIDRCIHYAGWADKYQQIFSAVNPVSSSHFNFSMLEATGVVSIYAPEENGLIGLVSSILPVICGGNTCIVLASESKPAAAISFAEVLNASDVPGGVVNILTGLKGELLEHFSTHMDVNAMIYWGEDKEEYKKIQQYAVSNLKRTQMNDIKNWYGKEAQSPYLINQCQETKTTWHPIGI